MALYDFEYDNSFNLEPTGIRPTHTSEVSTYSEPFPVDEQTEAIATLVQRTLPDTISRALLQRAAIEETTTAVIDGGIQLYPQSAALRIKEMSPDLRSKFNSANLLIGAITGGIRPRVLHINRQREDGTLTHFNMAIVSQRQGAVYELAGEVGEPNLSLSEQLSHFAPAYSSSTVIAHKNEGRLGDRVPESLLPLDAALVLDVLYALSHSQKMPIEELLPSDLDGRLQRVIDKSPHKVESSGTYTSFSRRSSSPLIITLGQRVMIDQNNARTTDYNVAVEERASFSGIDGEQAISIRKLVLGYNDRVTKQPYKAQLDLAIIDSENHVPIRVRDRHFATLSSLYRNNPSAFFTTLNDVCLQLSAPDGE